MFKKWNRSSFKNCLDARKIQFHTMQRCEAAPDWQRSIFSSEWIYQWIFGVSYFSRFELHNSAMKARLVRQAHPTEHSDLSVIL
jgi:hypothetical protein